MKTSVFGYQAMFASHMTTPIVQPKAIHFRHIVNQTCSIVFILTQKKKVHENKRVNEETGERVSDTL